MLARPPEPLGLSPWLLPDPSTADETGLVGFGADLAPETLISAYRSGLFPWPHEGLPLPWFSPDPRGVILLRGLHVSRSLHRRLRGCGWHTTVDVAFDTVIRHCANSPRPGQRGTWVTPEMRAAYGELHRRGWAHSVEVWHGHELAGGIYGVQVGACFTGESMFHVAQDGSKVALVDLVERFARAGGVMVDVQLVTPHLASLGAVEVPRDRFLAALVGLRDRDVRLWVDRLPAARLAAFLAAGRPSPAG